MTLSLAHYRRSVAELDIDGFRQTLSSIGYSHLTNNQMAIDMMMIIRIVETPNFTPEQVAEAKDYLLKPEQDDLLTTLKNSEARAMIDDPHDHLATWLQELEAQDEVTRRAAYFKAIADLDIPAFRAAFVARGVAGPPDDEHAIASMMSIRILDPIMFTPEKIAEAKRWYMDPLNATWLQGLREAAAVHEEFSHIATWLQELDNAS